MITCHMVKKSMIPAFFPEIMTIFTEERNSKSSLTYRGTITALDLRNNGIGQDIGSGYQGNTKGLVNSVIQTYKSEGLWTASLKDGKWIIEKTTLTDEQFHIVPPMLHNACVMQ